MDYRRRIEEFRRHMDEAGLDAWLIARPENLRYLSGFPGEDSLLLVTRTRTALLTDSRYVELAEREACADEVVKRTGPIWEAAGGLCARLGVRRLAVTASNISHADFVALAEAAPRVELQAAEEGTAERMRMRKDADEVRAVRAAAKLAEEGLAALLEAGLAGRSERWLAARLEFEMRARGADSAAFETICAVGPRASMPHSVPGQAKATRRQAVLLDWGARLEGYCSDLTRIICPGRIPRKLRDLVELVLEAQAAALEALRPGSRGDQVDAAAREVIARSGHAEHFGHGVGHGVGLSVHEGPRLGPRSESVLEPGMVVTVEPGIYLPGEVGVRLEQMALVTADGCEVLTMLPQRPEEFNASAG